VSLNIFGLLETTPQIFGENFLVDTHELFFCGSGSELVCGFFQSNPEKLFFSTGQEK